MISPRWFGEQSYAGVVQSIVENKQAHTGKFEIVIKQISEDSVEINTVERKLNGKIALMFLQTTFSLTEEGIQTGVMTALSYQADKDWYEGFLIVSEAHGRFVEARADTLQEAVSRLAKARRLRPSEAFYLEPIFKRRQIFKTLTSSFSNLFNWKSRIKN